MVTISTIYKTSRSALSDIKREAKTSGLYPIKHERLQKRPVLYPSYQFIYEKTFKIDVL